MTFKPLLTTFFILFTVLGYAQTRVVFIQKPGEPTIEEIRKKARITKQKLGDSAWLARQYDMHDSLMISCTFKDENLTIPNGRFFEYYYPGKELHIRFNYITHKNDSVITNPKNRLLHTGFYVNGLKTGNWCDYDDTGFITHVTTFDNNKENGVYRSFSTDTRKLILEGHYINGRREGRWNMVSFDGDTTRTDIYKHDEIIKTVSNLSKPKFKYEIKGGKPEYNFEKYLNSKLANLKVNEPGTLTHYYAFTLNKEGKLIDPLVTGKHDMAIDTIIIDAIMQAPNWKPAYLNGNITEIDMPMKIESDVSDNKHIRITVNELYIPTDVKKSYISTSNKIIAPN